MKKIAFLFLVLVHFNGLSQDHDEKMLVGIQSKENFEQQPFSEWYNPNYKNAKLDAAVVKKIKKNIKGVTIKAFMGTWCGDSQHEIPIFYKLMDAINFDYNNLNMIAVNRSKETPDNLQKDYHITNVPTFIFYKKGKEIGRFVEYPRETLEKDMLKIVSGKPYKHSYEEK
ncbi:MAG: thioredoxin family protein [Flavobacteriaceae bacterium]|nr:thioredoxin family protein [Flavobacteriaceae bacterium]